MKTDLIAMFLDAEYIKVCEIDKTESLPRMRTSLGSFQSPIKIYVMKRLGVF